MIFGMAIYHFSVKTFSRNSIKTIVASAAYRAGTKLTHFDSSGVTLGQYDYSKKTDVFLSEILSPLTAPTWSRNRQELWNKVEQSETRKNARLAREIELSIPVELSNQQRVTLVRDFVNDILVSDGMVADIAYHGFNGHNPHAHILLTTREITKDGFSKKRRDWDSKANLIQWRKLWEFTANEMLKKAGYEEQITCESLEKQKVKNRLPTIHLGPKVHALLKQGILTDKAEEYLEILEFNKTQEMLTNFSSEKTLGNQLISTWQNERE